MELKREKTIPVNVKDLTNVIYYEIMLSQDKLGNYMKSIKVLTAVALTTLSLVAVAADKPAEKKAKKAEAKPA